MNEGVPVNCCIVDRGADKVLVPAAKNREGGSRCTRTTAVHARTTQPGDRFTFLLMLPNNHRKSIVENRTVRVS